MLYYNTVNEHLIGYLKTLMSSEVFNSFRLVGGTALSLQLGHRTSVDIDLFSDLEYGSIDFKIIDTFLKSEFKYVFRLPICCRRWVNLIQLEPMKTIL